MFKTGGVEVNRSSLTRADRDGKSIKVTDKTSPLCVYVCTFVSWCTCILLNFVCLLEISEANFCGVFFFLLNLFCACAALRYVFF